MAGGECVPGPGAPCRLNLDLMDATSTSIVMYGLTLITLMIFAYGIYQMVHVWRMGRSWTPGDWRTGLKRLVVGVMTHRKFKQEPKGGMGHKWVFYGFLGLFITTTIVAIDADFVELVLGLKLLKGGAYLFLEAFADFAGVFFLVGLGYLGWRRYVEKDPRLHRSTNPEAPWFKMNPDSHALLFLFLIGITGFLMEGIRIRHQINEFGIDYANWSFVGNAIGFAFVGTSQATLTGIYQPLWFIHFGLWMSVLAILPWTKLRHIVTSSLNLYFFDPERQGKASLDKGFDLADALEGKDVDITAGSVSNIRDFTWKDRLSFDACTNCGRCEEQCPAYAAGRPLSPRKLIQDLKTEMWEDYRAGKKDENHVPAPIARNNDVASQIDEATLWSCTTCRACVTECPVDINHVDMIVSMRRGLVNESRLDENQQKLLVNLTNAGNPYGFPASDRDQWRNSLPSGIEVQTAAEKTAKGESFEYLWWIGCTGSYDPRNQEVTKSIATILNAASVDFAILGTEERCNGDPARRLGEEGRFQQSVMENLAIMQQYGVTKIIAQCPHCFSTLANEYPDFGANFEVIHHSQLIEQLIEAGSVPLKEGKEMAISYHDSCYLGRHNGIFDAPRRILEKANNGLPVLEMAQSGEKGLCCGAGGANMWFEVKDETERINVIRAKQAADTGADTVATACPFCLTMLSDGLSLTGNDPASSDDGTGIVAKDIAEIVAEHLDWSPPEPEIIENLDDSASSSNSDSAAIWVG
jgi:Fe-S oxidoreductase/nitrate reductase gamma subunit